MFDSIKPRRDQRFHPEQPSQKKRKFRFRVFLAALMLTLLVAGIFVGSKLVIVAEKVWEGTGGRLSFGRFFMASDKPLRGETDGLIRILLMGIGGEAHQGGTLTDTLMVATIQVPKDKHDRAQVALFSIPRDLAVNIPGYDFRKINSAYAYGEVEQKGLGSKKAVEAVERLLQESIPYYAVLDFQGFEKIVDDLGGVEINVETGFTDSSFPDDKDGYLPPLTFAAGLQRMSGAKALQFVRSRHGNNDQGTDFARVNRQQQLLKALKDRVKGFRILSNLSLLGRLLDDLSDHLRTNIAPHELKTLYELTKHLETKDILSLSVDVESGLVCNYIDDVTGAYLLVPCSGLTDYQGIREAFRNQFSISALQTEKPTIEIQNAAGTGSLAQRTSAVLGLPYIEVRTANFKGQAAYQQSIIYDNTGGQKKASLKFLRETLGLTVAASPFPFPTSGPAIPDFVIVVANDIENKLK